MDPLVHQITQCLVDCALALDPIHLLKLHSNDFNGEMAFAAAVISGMTAMLGAVVYDPQMNGAEGLGETLFNFGRNRAFRFLVHGSYIGMLDERSTLGLTPKT
jgi:hypothetical protein